jgi:hypothetical protein
MRQPTTTPDETLLDWDTTLHTLAAPRRRYLLAALADASGEATLPDLSRQIHAAEQNVPRDAVTDEDANHVLVALRHTHVPKLVDTGIVEWTDDRQRTRLTQTAQSHPVLLPLARWSRYPPSMPTCPSESAVQSD